MYTATAWSRPPTATTSGRRRSRAGADEQGEDRDRDRLPGHAARGLERPEPEGAEHGEVVAAAANGGGQDVSQSPDAEEHEEDGQRAWERADVPQVLDVLWDRPRFDIDDVPEPLLDRRHALREGGPRPEPHEHGLFTRSELVGGRRQGLEPVDRHPGPLVEGEVRRLR